MTNSPKKDSEWKEWSNFVLLTLTRFEKLITNLKEENEALKKEILILKVKAAVIGAIAGSIFSAAIGIIIALIYKS